MDSGISDYINATKASGTLDITKINILKDGATSSINLFGNVAPSIASYTTYTGTAKYTFTQNSSSKGKLDITSVPIGGLYYAIHGNNFSKSILFNQR